MYCRVTWFFIPPNARAEKRLYKPQAKFQAGYVNRNSQASQEIEWLIMNLLLRIFQKSSLQALIKRHIKKFTYNILKKIGDVLVVNFNPIEGNRLHYLTYLV
jgi:hypothetical protein